MRHSAAHPPQGPTPPPGSPPGPYDPPDPPGQPLPPRRSCYAEQFRPPENLKASAMYPGMKTFHPEETCHHGSAGTPIRAINSRR